MPFDNWKEGNTASVRFHQFPLRNWFAMRRGVIGTFAVNIRLKLRERQLRSEFVEYSDKIHAVKSRNQFGPIAFRVDRSIRTL